MSNSLHNQAWWYFLCAIIEESHTALYIDLHLGYILNPVPMVKGIRIQEGGLSSLSYALGASSWGFLGVATFILGVWAPFFCAIPSLWFKHVFTPKAFTNGQ